jgi:hypothetical protein
MILRPLPGADTEELVTQLLGDETVERDLIDRITRAAEGNPLYVEEFVRMLRDDGRGNGDDGGSVRHLELALPPTIEALLAARLDRLQADERGVVDRAAVVGKVFWWGAVAELSAPREASVGSCLQALVRREFVVPEESIFAGEDAFRFSHILMRDAAYGSIPKSARARFHEAFAEWLVRKAGDRLAEYEEIVGYHLEQAYHYEEEIGEDELGAADLAEAAAAHLASAGRRAAQRADMHAATALLQRAADLSREGQRRIEILLELSDCLIEAGELEHVERVLTDARVGAQATGSASLQARVAMLRSILQLFIQPAGWTRAAGAEVEAAIQTFEEADDDVGLTHAYWTLARVHWLNLRASATEAALERALHYARRAGRTREEAKILTQAAFTAFLGPLEVDAAVARCEELAQRGRSNPLASSSILLATAALRAMRGEVEEARADADRAKQVLAELDLPFALAEAAQFAGIMELIVGDFKRAESELRVSCEILDRMGERSLLSTSAGLLGAALCSQGHHEEALDQTKIAEREGDQDDLATQELWRVVRARCLAHSGDLRTATRLAGEGVALMAETDCLNWHADALIGQAEVLHLAKQNDEAEHALAAAIQLYQQKGNVASVRRARALLDEIA